MPEEKAYGITVTIMNIVRSKMSTVGIIARMSLTKKLIKKLSFYVQN